MKRFRLRVLLTVLIAVGFVILFGWGVALQNYRSLAGEAAGRTPLNREAVSEALNHLSETWTDYEKRIINRYETEAVFASLALQSVMDEEDVREISRENGLVISIEDGRLSPSDPAVRRLGLDASLFQGNHGSFAAPNQPATYVAYSRIGDTFGYFVKWYENTVIDDIVREAVDIPGILKWTEITYNVPAMFVSRDPDTGEISDILYRNSRYLSDCGSLADLGLTQEDLQKNDAKASGTVRLNDVRFSYVSGASELPAGYVILLEPIPDPYAKAFVQAGYMIAVLIILVVTLLVTGFSLYSYVHSNILTPEEEKKYKSSHVRSIASLFGVFGLVLIALSGMFSYALNTVYDDTVRGRERLAMMDESISMYADRYSQNLQSFRDVYLDYGNQIADLLDTYPQLRDPAVLSSLAESISASSITLYDSDGLETVSSGRWNGLVLSTDPKSTTYEFRRILRGVPSVVHDPETDEVTGLHEMRLGIRIRDDEDEDRCGVLMLCVDISAMTSQDINPESAVRQVLSNLSNDGTTLWISDAKTGQVLVSGRQEMEGQDIAGLGFSESDLKDSLMKKLKTEEGTFFVMSASVENPKILEWAGAKEGMIAFCREPKTSFLPGMVYLAVIGCILFLVIYCILAWMTLSGYTDDFFNANKHIKGQRDPKKRLSRFRRAVAAATPVRKGIAAMEILTAFFLLQVILIANSDSTAARNTVYSYITAGDWERGFNLFSIAAIVMLLAKAAVLVIALRLLLAICASFSASKGRTIFRLLSNVIFYIAVIIFLIKALEYLGFSMTAIAAGVGSLALAISLGAQSFVADIFAGLTIVFEGIVHVGDNAEIEVSGGAPFHGKIVEVGIRCIKLLTREGDLITCSNRDIRLIKNSTQMNSRVICELAVSSSIPSSELEQMLKTELPKIGQTDRQILSGPSYNGITGISGGTMTLSVSAECNEEDYYYVRDKLYASLQRIFMEHGYNI